MKPKKNQPTTTPLQRDTNDQGSRTGAGPWRDAGAPLNPQHEDTAFPATSTHQDPPHSTSSLNQEVRGLHTSSFIPEASNPSTPAPVAPFDPTPVTPDARSPPASSAMTLNVSTVTSTRAGISLSSTDSCARNRSHPTTSSTTTSESTRGARKKKRSKSAKPGVPPTAAEPDTSGSSECEAAGEVSTTSVHTSGGSDGEADTTPDTSASAVGVVEGPIPPHSGAQQQNCAHQTNMSPFVIRSQPSGTRMQRRRINLQLERSLGTIPEEGSGFQRLAVQSYETFDQDMALGMTCSFCGLLTMTSEGWDAHQQAHLRDMPCSYCGLVFISTMARLLHEWRHWDTTTGSPCDALVSCQCGLCECYFVGLQYLELHLVEVHGMLAAFESSNYQMSVPSPNEELRIATRLVSHRTERIARITYQSLLSSLAALDQSTIVCTIPSTSANTVSWISASTSPTTVFCTISTTSLNTISWMPSASRSSMAVICTIPTSSLDTVSWTPATSARAATVVSASHTTMPEGSANTRRHLTVSTNAGNHESQAGALAVAEPSSGAGPSQPFQLGASRTPPSSGSAPRDVCHQISRHLIALGQLSLLWAARGAVHPPVSASGYRIWTPDVSALNVFHHNNPHLMAPYMRNHPNLHHFPGHSLDIDQESEEPAESEDPESS